MENQLLTIQEAAKMLGIRPVTLRKWDREGKLKAIRIGSRGDRKYRKQDLDEFINNPRKKIVWQEYIRNGITYRFVSLVLESMTSGLKNQFGQGLSYLMGYFQGDNLFWYYDNRDLYNVGEIIANKLVEPLNQLKFITDSKNKSQELLELIKINNLNQFAKANDKKLADIYEKYAQLVYEDNSMSLSIDALDEYLMVNIKNKAKSALEKILANNYSEKGFNEVYNTLIKPSKLSYINKEREMTLKLVDDIKNGKISKNSDNFNERAKKIIELFWWTNLGWARSDTKTPHDILRNVEEIEKAKININNELQKIASYNEITKKERDELEKKYHLRNDGQLANLLDLYDKFVEYHDFRKEVQMKTNFWEYQMLDEISKRKSLPVHLLNWAEVKELVYLLRNNKIDQQELNQRSINFIYLYINGKIEKISGKAAERRHSEILGLELEETRDIQGITASSGTIIGEAYVAISINEALKIKTGQILITGMTTPDFVPAMRKASAIVTDEGGMTCHAAIISRELDIPCIVGTKYATRLIKTGDKIEVRANHGVIKILEQNGN